jgi:hypothetical protein
MAFAEGINTQGFCFNDLFRQVVDFSIFDNVNTELTMIFEMVSPKNRIVKRYEQDDVYLLAVRNKKTGEEYNDVELKEFAYKLGLKVPKVYPFNSEDAVFSAFKDIDPFDEGFVCVNYETKHRIKIKNPSYVAIAHLRENGVISPKRIAILVMEQDHEEYLNIFPEDAQFFNPYIDAFERMKEDIHNAQAQFSSIAEQKEFALAIQHLPVKSILFQLRKGLQLAAVLDKLSVDSKLNLLEKYKR